MPHRTNSLSQELVSVLLRDGDQCRNCGTAVQANPMKGTARVFGRTASNHAVVLCRACYAKWNGHLALATLLSPPKSPIYLPKTTRLLTYWGVEESMIVDSDASLQGIDHAAHRLPSTSKALGGDNRIGREAQSEFDLGLGADSQRDLNMRIRVGRFIVDFRWVPGEDRDLVGGQALNKDFHDGRSRCGIKVKNVLAILWRHPNNSTHKTSSSVGGVVGASEPTEEDHTKAACG